MLERPHFALNPSRTLVARASGHLQVALWWVDRASDTPICELPSGGHGLGGLHFPSDAELWVLSSDGSLASWDVSRLIELGERAEAPVDEAAAVAPEPEPAGPTPRWKTRIEADVTASAGQDRFLAVGDRKGRVWLVEAHGEKAHVRLGTEGHADAVMALAFARGGLSLASSGRDRVIRTWRSADAEGLSESSVVGASEVLELFSIAADAEEGEEARGGPRAAPLRADRTLTGLEGWQVALQFSPDSGRLVSGGVDQGLYLWDLSSAEDTAQHIQFAHSGWIADVAWSPDGTVIATASWDTTIGLFDGRTLEPRVCLQLHRDYVADVEFAGPRLVAASHDREISVWRWAERQLETVLTGHADWVQAIALLPRDELLSLASDRTARVWSLARGEALHVVGAMQAHPTFEVGAPVDMSAYVDLSGLASYERPTTTRRARYRDFRASGFRSATEQTALGLLEGAIARAPVSPSRDPLETPPLGLPAASSAAEDDAGPAPPKPPEEVLEEIVPPVVEETAQEKRERIETAWRREPSIGTTTIRRLPPVGEGEEPAEPSIAGPEIITSFETPSDSQELPILMGLGDEPSERFESVSGPGAEFEPFLDPPSTEMGELDMAGQLSEAELDEPGDLAQTVDPSVFRTHSWPKPLVEDEDHLPSQTGEWDVSFDEESAASSSVALEIVVPADEVTAEIPAERVAELRARSDEVSQTGSHEIWERLPSRATPRSELLSQRAAPGAMRFALDTRIKTPHGFVYGIAISPDGRMLATCGGDNSLCVWNRKGDLLHRVRMDGDSLNAVDFSFDGRAVAAGGDDRTLHLWLLPPREDPGFPIEHATLRGHDGWITDVCFSPDGSFVLTGSYDGTARVWKLASGQCVRTLAGHDGAVSGVAIGTTRAVTVGHDGTVRMWNQRWVQVDQLEVADRLLGISTNGDIAAYCAANGEVFILRDGRPSRVAEHDGQARAVLVRGDGVTFSAGEDGVLRVYGAGANAATQTLVTPSPLWCVDAKSDVAAAGADDGFVYVFSEA